MYRLFVWGALAGAALLGGETGDLISLLRMQTKEQVLQAWGRPKSLADFGPDFQSWMYEMGPAPDEEFTHVAVIRRSTGALVSLARHFETERSVDELFPANETFVCQYPEPGKPEYGLRVRLVRGDRVLIAMGSSKTGQPAGQLLIVRREEVRSFYPWLEPQIRAAEKRR